jgi:phosphate transport system ATP-binding protein
MSTSLELKNVSVTFSGRSAVRNVSFATAPGRITALIGPSGSGKTTLLRSINRMHDLNHLAKVSGEIILDGRDVYRDYDAMELRGRVGMVFQKPNPFTTMSVFDNVASGLRFNGIRDKKFIADAVEHALRTAVLWDSVKDRLASPAKSLSGGEQQRLCIARSLAVEPEVVLFDEPTSALDPIATAQIEELLKQLKEFVAVVIVTHNMEQAKRIADDVAFLLMASDGAGELIEFAPTEKIFNEPRDSRTHDYVAGRFG